MSLFEELKRRNVLKVAASYAVVGWLIAQVAEFATSTFGAPAWVLPTFVVLLALGLPIAIVLAWAFNMTPEGIKKAADAGETRSDGRGTNWIVIGLMGVVLVSALVLHFWIPSIRVVPSAALPNSANDLRPLNVDVAFPDDTPLAFVGAAALGNGRHAFSLSPDGRYLVYQARESAGHALYLRDLSSRDTRRLNGTENGYGPFFSPNGRWIAFFSGNLLKRVSIEGGEAVTMTEATNSAGGTWLGNDTIVAFTDEGGRLLTFSFDGTRDEREAPARGTAPFALPDSSKVIWAVFGEGLAVFDIESEELDILPIDGRDPRYMEGFLFFSRGNSLFAARFDPVSETLESTPVPVLTGLRVEAYSFSQWALSSNGNLLYAPGTLAAENPLVWAQEGNYQNPGLPRRPKGTFELSPDGKRLAIIEYDTDSSDIWLYELENGRNRKLTLEGDVSNPLVWMPNGKEITYHRASPGARTPYVLSLNSGNPGKPLLDSEGASNLVDSVSRDGRYLGASRYFTEPESGGESLPDKVLIVDRQDGNEIEIPMAGQGNWGVTVSPDGRWVVYTSPVSGEYQNYLQPVPPTGERYQVSRVGGAEEPRWSPDGKKIYYRSGQRIMVVDVQTDPELKLSEPRVFHEGDFVNVSGRSFDIDPDGSRALIIQGSEEIARSVRMITHWLDRVKELVDGQD
jgi:serine/threonine-protein kinase